MDDVTKMRLIELYRSNRCLWDKEDGNYHNRVVRENSWQEISDMLGIPTRTLVKQMGCLLSSFRREERRVRDMSAKGKLYTPQWKFYNMFLFRSSIDDDADADGDNFENPNGESSSFITPKLETNVEEIENIDGWEQNYDEYLNPSTTTVKSGLNFQYGKRIASDEFSAMGIMVEAKLRKMDSHQRLFAENIINQALYKGCMSQLSADSQICNVSEPSTVTSASISSPTKKHSKKLKRNLTSPNPETNE